MFPWHVQLVVLSVLLPLGAGLVKWRIAPRPMRLLTVLLLYAALSDIFSVTLAIRAINNIFLFHAGVIVFYPILALLFSYWHSRRSKRLLRWSIPIFIAAVLLLFVLGYETLERPPSHSLSVMSIMLAITSLYTLFTLMRDGSNYPVYRDERFWVSLGVFMSYATTTFIYSGIMDGITDDIWIAHNIIHTIGNLCYLVGFLWMQTPTTS